MISAYALLPTTHGIVLDQEIQLLVKLFYY
jgi:hypothetical protein